MQEFLEYLREQPERVIKPDAKQAFAQDIVSELESEGTTIDSDEALRNYIIGFLEDASEFPSKKDIDDIEELVDEYAESD